MADTPNHTAVIRRTIPSFDGTENVEGDFARPEKFKDLYDALAGDGPLIARGAGLSYCNAGAGPGVRAISSLRFNRVLAFDAERGVVTVEPGLAVGDLLEFAVARGWHLPALPGHPCITVGGCVAFNVHGKTQHNVGNFGDYVEGFRLFHPMHGEFECSARERPEVFRLTIGGFGLTGFITQVRLRLTRLPSAHVVYRRALVPDLAEAVREMERRKETANVLYSWNDLNRRGASFGRGVVYSEEFVPGEDAGRLKRRRLSPERRTCLPFNLYNRWTASWMNIGYRLMESALPRESRRPLMANAFPIGGKEFYYAFFGRAGLREYQVIVPRDGWESAVKELDAMLGEAGAAYTLGSLKLFSGRTDLLTFRGDGVCLALDAPADRRSAELFAKLDEWVIAHHGIANLSKDSRLSADVVKRMYPEYERFRADLRAYDPGARFDSALRRRLDV